MTFLKGLHYQNSFFYDLCTFFKLGLSCQERYKIAVRYIEPGSIVLDVCAGLGELKRFLPNGCRYKAIDASAPFALRLSELADKIWHHDLHKGFPSGNIEAEVIVMIISLYQFRKTSLDQLLEQFKGISRKVVVVEEILGRKRSKNNLLQRVSNYLCATDYFVPVELFTGEEFDHVMRQHQYTSRTINERYRVGCYGF